MIITPLLVIFMLVVFVLLFLFLKTIDKRKWLTFIISLVLTPVIYFYLAYPFINIISNYHHQKYFDAEIWTKKPDLRYEMIENALVSHALIDKTKTEIETLLGKAEWLTWKESNKMHDNDRWNYSLGIKPGAFTDQKDVLEITFKDNKTTALKTYKEAIVFDAKEQD
jgi:hypothetical protein